MELSLEGTDEMEVNPLYVVRFNTSPCRDARIGLPYESFLSLYNFFRFLAVFGILERNEKCVLCV